MGNSSLAVASPFVVRPRPPAVVQKRENDCWAACLECWFRAEAKSSWTQEQLVRSAPDFVCGPGGISMSGLQDIIRDVCRISTVDMNCVIANSASQVPKVFDIIAEVGHVFVAYLVNNRGGHANVLYGFDRPGGTLYAFDPDPAVGFVVRQFSSYFTILPAFVGWRTTAAMPGMGWTGRPTWDYE
jgi:hypothetical protein